MKDRIQRCDNFGQDVPKPYGTGLESYTQKREFGDDLFVVRDPQVVDARIVAEIDCLMEVEE